MKVCLATSAPRWQSVGCQRGHNLKSSPQSSLSISQIFQTYVESLIKIFFFNIFLIPPLSNLTSKKMICLSHSFLFIQVVASSFI